MEYVGYYKNMPEHMNKIQESVFNLSHGDLIQLTSFILILIYLIWRFKK